MFSEKIERVLSRSFCSAPDFRPGVDPGLRQSVAPAAGPDHPACHRAVHHAALLPWEPSVPAHHPQQGGGGQKRWLPHTASQLSKHDSKLVVLMRLNLDLNFWCREVWRWSEAALICCTCLIYPTFACAKSPSIDHMNIVFTSRLFNPNPNPFFSSASPCSSGASAWLRRRERWHSGDEGGSDEDGQGEEGHHVGTLPLSQLPPAHHHRHHPAALPAVLRHQCSELLSRVSDVVLKCQSEAMILWWKMCKEHI